MRTKNNHLPENWRELSLANYYYYKDTLVRRFNRDNGEIELVAMDFNNKRAGIIAEDFCEAIGKMERRLNFSE